MKKAAKRGEPTSSQTAVSRGYTILVLGNSVIKHCGG